MWLFNLLFSSLSQLWYVQVRISRSVSVSPLEFEITGVECIYKYLSICKQHTRLLFTPNLSMHPVCGSHIHGCLPPHAQHRVVKKKIVRRSFDGGYGDCSGMTGQRSERSAMSSCKTPSPLGSLIYLCSLALRIWTSFWRKEGSAGMDMWNTPMVQSRQPVTYWLMERMGLGGPRWYGSSWQRGIVESGSFQLSTLMTDTPGDLVWDLPCLQQASYLEGAPLIWMLPLFVFVEVLRPSQPNGVMSSVVSLPNHTFTGQA